MSSIRTIALQSTLLSLIFFSLPSGAKSGEPCDTGASAKIDTQAQSQTRTGIYSSIVTGATPVMTENTATAGPQNGMPTDPLIEGLGDVTAATQGEQGKNKIYTEFETPSGVALAPGGDTNTPPTRKEKPALQEGATVFAKPAVVKNVIGGDGKRSVVIEKDTGTETFEWPPIDDPIFVDNPFRKPVKFVPDEKNTGKPEEKKTVVAWWDKALKNFKLTQNHLNNLLKKRQKMLDGKKSAEELDNKTQAQKFDFEIFKIDQQITGTTGTLNKMKEYLDQFGKLEEESDDKH